MRGVFAVIVLVAVCFGLWLVFFGAPMNASVKRVTPVTDRAETGGEGLISSEATVVPESTEVSAESL